MPDVGNKVSQMRREKGWTLSQAGQATGVAPSTLSKIEREEISPTIATLKKIAQGFGHDLLQFLSPVEHEKPMVGRRTITRSGQGIVHTNKTCRNEIVCPDLKQKKMMPIVTKIFARTVDDYDSWSKDKTEIFLYVLKGTLIVHSRLYEPVELREGDSMYYDASSEHVWTSKGDIDAEILWLISDNQTQQI